MRQTVRVAGIDCGTNSIRLMIADVHKDGIDVVVPRTMQVVRLGQGIDKTHRFDPQALDRTFSAAKDFAQIISQYNVDVTRFVATSATRDATNRQEFDDKIHELLGVYPEVISGKTEARLSFLGATTMHQQVMKESQGAPYLIIDLGGGSTELVLGDVHNNSEIVTASISMNIGSVRMSERHLSSHPPTLQQIEEATIDIDHHIHDAMQTVPLKEARTVIGVSGTVTTMSLLALGYRQYSSEAVDGAIVNFDKLYQASHNVLAMTSEQMSEIPLIHPGRRDVIAGGALVWERLLKTISQQVSNEGRNMDSYIASEHGLLDGLIIDEGHKLLGI